MRFRVGSTSIWDHYTEKGQGRGREKGTTPRGRHGRMKSCPPNLSLSQAAVGARRSLILAVCCAAMFSTAARSEGKPHEDDNDAAGRLDIAKVELRQKVHKLVFELRTRDDWSTKALTKYPSSPTADGRRFICLKLSAKKTSPRLLCAGGKRSGRLGRLRLIDGAAKRRGSVPARVRRPRANRLEISFRPSAGGLDPGRFRWSVFSGWSGPECRPPAASDGTVTSDQSEPAEQTSPSDSLCLDRTPDGSRTFKGRVFKLRPSGCTRRAGNFVRRGPSSRKTVALTFDDGPGAYTSKVLHILDRKRVDATFYHLGALIGSRARLMRSATAAGHEIGNHSWRHTPYPSFADLRMTSRAIRRATGFSPCTFRPPGGAVNGPLVSRADAAGMTTVLWDIDTRDWTTPGLGAIHGAAARARPGSIVLMHDAGGYRGQTVAALPRIISTLRSRGYRFATVHELLGGRTLYKKVR